MPVLVLTTTGPVDAPDGTVATIAVELQLVVVAVTPLKVTVPLVPKLIPLIVTELPAIPDVVLRLVILGAGVPVPTVNTKGFEGTPRTVTITFPVVAVVGTVATTSISVQLVTVATTPLKATVLSPCVEPKWAPAILTDRPATPELGVRLVRVGGGLLGGGPPPKLAGGNTQPLICVV